MKNRVKSLIITAVCLLAAFAAWTAAVLFVDVGAIGPIGSSVGLASVNLSFHRLTGVHPMLYTVTDWLGLVPILFALGFALLGLCQWARRGRLGRVDRSLLALGAFYIAVMVFYALFEKLCVNYRPVLIDGALEVSYPSSTTMLSLCVMPTALMQLSSRIKHRGLRQWVGAAIGGFTAFMVIGRLISGVHWATDIIGSVLLSFGLFKLYQSAVTATDMRNKNGVQ